MWSFRLGNKCQQHDMTVCLLPTQRPIALTCNDPRHLAFLGAVTHLKLDCPSGNALLEQLVYVAAQEGIHTHVQRLAHIVQSCNRDIR